MHKRNDFRRTVRIRNRKDFENISIQRHLKYVFKRILVKCLHKQEKTPRLGISIHKECGGATWRNRIKRLIREYFRHNKEKFAHWDLHIIAKTTRKKVIKEQFESELYEDLQQIGKKIELLNQSTSS